MNSMRILILTPSRFPGTTGNAITTERWRRSLTAAGAVVEVLSSSELESSEFAEHLRSFRPDVIHIHHAFRTAVLVLDPLIRPQIETLPLVVSPGGTDINLDIGMAERKETVLSVLNMARIILVQGGDTAQSVWRNLLIALHRLCMWPRHSAGSETKTVNSGRRQTAATRMYSFFCPQEFGR